jgi:hypothetical protein
MSPVRPIWQDWPFGLDWEVGWACSTPSRRHLNAILYVRHPYGHPGILLLGIGCALIGAALITWPKP